MPGPTAPRAKRALRVLAAIQVFLLLASLFAPIPIAAADPSPDPSAPATSAEASPSATPESTLDPSPVPTPDSSPTPAPEATSAPTTAPTVAPAAAPTISSDKADYAPGELVTLAGSNWHAGETVHIYVNDSVGSTWSRNVDVVADAGGGIADQFSLPNWFVATYSVVATGSVSGSAVATFTDAIATSLYLIDSVSPSVVGQSVTFTATVTYAQSGAGHTSGDPVTEGTVVFGEDGNANCGGGGFILHQSAQTPNASGQVTFTTSSLTAGSHFIRACYNGTGGSTGTSNSNSALTLVVNACSAPSITIQPTGQSITYGADATFTVAASGSPAPSVLWQVDSGSGFTSTGVTTATLTLIKPAVSLSGNSYRAVFTNSCGSATSSAATLTVTPKTVTITPDSGQSKVYGAADPTLTFTHSALGGSDTDSVFTGALSRAIGENVGAYAIDLGTLSAGGNYTLVLAATPVTFAITPKTVTIKANDQTKTLGNTFTFSGTEFTVSVGTLVGTDAISSVTLTSLGAAAGAAVGSYPIVPSAAVFGSGLASNYAITYANGNLQVVYSTAACLGSAGHTILQPINEDGSSVFRQGSTVPAKFRVCDALGNSIGTAGLVVSFRLVQVTNGTITFVDEAVDSTTPDSAFRWSSSDQQWIFNISTKSLSKNKTYYYQITLNDGTTIDFHFGLK